MQAGSLVHIREIGKLPRSNALVGGFIPETDPPDGEVAQLVRAQAS